jgi:hypothetical protein
LTATHFLGVKLGPKGLWKSHYPQNPGAKRKAEKVAQGDTFEAIARESLALQEPKLVPATFAKATWTLETLIFPGLGKRPFAKITAPDLLTVLRKIHFFESIFDNE